MCRSSRCCLRSRLDRWQELADEGHAAKVLPHGLDGSESRVQELLVLHRREQFLDDDVLGNA